MRTGICRDNGLMKPASRLKQLAPLFAMIGFLLLGLMQACAIYSYFRDCWGWWFVFAAFGATTLGYVPLVGAIAGTIAAHNAWGWGWTGAILLFWWPFPLMIVLAALDGGLWFLRKPRVLPLMIFAFAFQGCATAHIGDLFDGGDATQQRKAARRDPEIARKTALQEELGIGSTMEEFRAAWDEPDREEVKDGKTVWRYDNMGNPRFFAFKDGKLVEHWYDDSGKAEIDSKRDRRRGTSCYTSCALGVCSTECNPK